MNIRYRVDLSDIERRHLTALLNGGKHAARKIKRAQILLEADAGVSDDVIAIGRPGHRHSQLRPTAAVESYCERARMPRKPVADTTTMLKQVAEAIAKADGADMRDDAARYLRLGQAAVKPLAKPTETMIDAAHEAVWSDGFWAINSRRDFHKAVRAMILAALAS